MTPRRKPDAPEPAPSKSVLVRIPADWYEVLRVQAFQERRPMAVLVREALREKFGFTGGEPADDDETTQRKGGAIAYPSGGTSAPRFCDSE